jgi:hypothetical protein
VLQSNGFDAMMKERTQKQKTISKNKKILDRRKEERT